MTCVRSAHLNDFASIVSDSELRVEVSVEDASGGVDERFVEVEDQRLVSAGVW